MKNETFKGEVASAYGETLPKPIAFSGSYEAYESYEEMQSKNDVPSNDDVLTFRNNQLKANARAKATTAALDAAGIAKPDPNSPEALRATFIKTLMKAKGLSEADAAQVATGLGM